MRAPTVEESQHWSRVVPSKRNAKKALLGELNTTLSSFRARPELLDSVATDFYVAINTPVSLSCEILLRYGEREQLARKTVDPRHYKTSFSFRNDYQAVAFLKKAPVKIAGVDPEAAAREKFLEAEEACRLTNIRIRNFISSPERVTGPVRRVISTAMGKIDGVLGQVNSREWLHACRFGPGAFNHPRVKGLTSLYDKLQVRPSVSHDMRQVGAYLVTSAPQWARSITDSEVAGFWPLINEKDLDVIPGNRVAFVPKTAVTHRAIAIEPLLNVYAQLGLGTMIRRRLQRVGIDLDDQTPNQRAAFKGSCDDSLATIDLSSASDTVARELVRLLLPEGWFSVLDLTRSKVGFYQDKWIRYEKFSSMGNGYTFELESLIFWALSVGVCTELQIGTDEVLVYGDDIVVPKPAYDLLEEVLTFCGFSLNKAKSFKEGPFRESCGKDYFNGSNVRPFFQKEIPHEIQDLFRLANGLRMLASRWSHPYGCDQRLRSPWSTVVRAIPRSVVRCLRVPAHADDSAGLKSNWDESQDSPFVISNKDGWEGVSGLRYQSCPVEGPQPSNMLGAVASLLYRLGDGGKFQRQLMGHIPKGWEASWLKTLGDSVSASPRQERGCTYRLRNGAFYGPWTDLGPWV
ncbi:TPA_asm: RNA-directed RNA polymerase [ssRNA phage Gephyllon.2_12]|uniref:RNA-directed RNA polymerase n=2 Tax=Fiersviridae TaxID=2842319 RepID=A0A8S5L3F3_9VIRU|nr:RNA-directed RNA polymerase [ssRNA phage Gephyllon.2_12]QDH88857.1 MAG: RNA-dependent RNA polymerase [Leviviridae sp.]DAD51853.1 TPA_asm: RNA-directed RNA polymerase [ssRNA phage Gephyllon.2_12]